MAGQELTVLVVSTDRGVLRQLAWLLADFGYHAVTCADLDQVVASACLTAPQVIIVDEDIQGDALQLIRMVRDARRIEHQSVFLLTGQDDSLDVLQAVEAGCDDFLIKPINHAEVLARLRVAARSYEFERRAASLELTDHLTGLATRAGLLDRLAQETSPATGSGRRVACVVFEIDHFDHYARQFGQSAAEELLLSVADRLREQCGRANLAARISPARFCAALPDTSLEKAMKWGDRLSDRLVELEYVLHDEVIRLTASFGFAGGPSDELPGDELLRQAAAALEMAQQSGGDCLMQYGQFAAERREWCDCLISGNPFEGATARDVMTPFTLWLETDESVETAAAKVRAGQLPLTPVFAEDGRLAGVVRQDDLETALGSAGPHATVDSVQLTDFVTAEEHSDYRDIMSHFFSEDSRPVVVFRDGAPRGFLTRNSFGALVAKVELGGFAPVGPAADDDTLVVADAERDRMADLAVGASRAESSGLAERVGGTATIDP